jgi:hypothetical protein
MNPGMFREPAKGGTMAKKRARKMKAAEVVRTSKPVRLELSPDDHERLEQCARRRGLSLASYARQAVLERITADEVDELKRSKI